LVSSGCTGKHESVSGKIGVIVSIPPQKEMVERIGGEKVSVTVMVPPGANPHTYEPLPSQLEEAARAKVYVEVGSGIEFELAWLDKILAVNRDLKVINSSAGIGLMKSADPDEPGLDTHIWTSVRNAEKMAQNVCLGLSGIDPSNAGYYQKNLDSYLKELDALDLEIAAGTSSLGVRKFIVYHPAWGYFARDYGLEQIGIEQEGKEPSARWMSEVVDIARRENISVIFASPEYSTASAEALSREIGGRVVLIDPLSEDYVLNMRNVSRAFAGL